MATSKTMATRDQAPAGDGWSAGPEVRRRPARRAQPDGSSAGRANVNRENVNRVVVAGVVHGGVERRELASGSVVVTFDVAVQLDSGRVVVPVSWTDPPDRPSLEVGAGLVVIGQVRRRFFRSGGATQSRTEVVAETVLAAQARSKVRQALEGMAAELTGAAPGAPGA